MGAESIVGNDRQAHEIASKIEKISEALSSEQIFKSLVEGLPTEVVEAVRKSLDCERFELIEVLAAYQAAKTGSFDALRAKVGDDPGAQLIVARVTRGWSQKELARRLFIPEQQVQRYEAERYRSISLSSLIRVARTLGVRLTANIGDAIPESWLPSYEMSSSEAQKVLKHARDNGWIDKVGQSDEGILKELKRTVAEHVGEFGTPSLLRTGLNVRDYSSDWLLLAWKAHVTSRARKIFQRQKVKYRPLDLIWLMDLVRLSVLDDGPVRAIEMLENHGIIVVIEPHVSGMQLDGAAFLMEETPVIGITLLRNSIDNFWFTLLHEVAHVILHYRTGLASGFFDDVDNPDLDELEEEADDFAINLLIPHALWNRSPARIAKDHEPVERLARQLNIAPAIIYGRIRMERKNYKIFSDRIGQGKVKKLFLDNFLEVTDE
ncbi:MAG: ImmA/IrrE family metallo-endopeptidase [Pseudomonas fluorescens]|uniref:ImmA/IrrE family metallo-endopeptidase n=1 Tax=Sphingopyxis sp. TaxID=1908224 RepID=UPI003D6C8BD1